MEVARRSERSAPCLARRIPTAVGWTPGSFVRRAATPRLSASREHTERSVSAARDRAPTGGAVAGFVLAAVCAGASCAISTVDSPGYAHGANQGVSTGFIPTTSFNLPPRPESCALDLIPVGQNPAHAIVPIGPVTTHTEGAGEDREMAVIRLKERACMVGAHGLMLINASAGGRWTEDGTYVWVAEGSATAFVYVDTAGRPVSAPGVGPVAFAVPPAPRTPPAPAPTAK
jgi:hypothetical protein